MRWSPLLADAPFPGIDGFLPGSRASIMLDVVFLAMFAVLPILTYSIYQVRFRQRYALHKTIQVALGVVLLLAVAAFEIDMQFLTDWAKRAEPSPFYAPGKWTGRVGQSLIVHLSVAVPTALLWIYVIVSGLRRFPNPPRPNEHSRSHVFWAKLAALGMFLTATTGWLFYYLAFWAK